MSTARLRWTNLILHTTASINDRKQQLLTAHAGQAVVIVVGLVLAEVWLAILSLPLYIATRSSRGVRSESTPAGTDQYSIRRVMTLSLVSIIFGAWLVKLLIIFLLSTGGPHTIVRTVANSPATLSSQLTVDVHLAKVDAKIPVPVITAVQRQASGITVSGTAQPHDTVVVILAQTDKGQSRTTRSAEVRDKETNPHLYSGIADSSGRFAITEDATIFWLPAGQYTATAVTFDPSKGIKSVNAGSVVFPVSDSAGRRILAYADSGLNIVVAMLVGLGLVVTILTV